MRKNKIGRKSLSLYYVYEITGLNLDNLVNTLKNKGIALYGVKKTGVKRLRVAVNYADNRKFFAITEELCYNIKKVGEKGGLRLFHRLMLNTGLIIGGLIFALTLVFADDFIFAIDYVGSGSVYEREVSGFLLTENVGLFSRFSRTDLPALADKIAAFSDNVSFAECVKVGNRLKITLVSAKTAENAVAYDKKELRSDVDGEIEFIKVYRGTALKSAGDRVTSGEPVCAGYAVVKDKTVEVGVIAVVSVKAEFIYVYTSGSDTESDIAEIFARASFGGDAVSVFVAPPVYNGENYDYTVRIIYRRLLYG